MYRLWNLDEIALCVTDHDERIVPDLSERKASGRLALPQQMVPTIDRDQITVGSFLTDTARTGALAETDPGTEGLVATARRNGSG